MSFPDHHPPPFMPRPFIDGDINGGWPVHPLDHSGYPVNHHEHLDPFLYSEQGPGHKRLRSSESNSPSYMQFPPPPNRLNPPPNLAGVGGKGTSHIFYKTRMCGKFIEGSCKNGATCTFAHGAADLREPPPNWQELIREKDGGIKSWNDDHRLIQKMKLCRKYYNGEECPYGPNCNFLHERPEQQNLNSVDDWPRPRTDMPVQRESAAISIGTRGAETDTTDRPVNLKPAYWKTKLCSKWEITGLCPFGERCHFAHGHSELHVPSAHGDADFRVNSSSSIQMKPAVPAIDHSHAKVDVGSQVKDTREDNNCSMWQPKKKINKIYGDWIDDLSPRRGSPVEAEDW